MSTPPRLGRMLRIGRKRRLGDRVEEIPDRADESLRVLTTLKATSQLKIAEAMMR